jgi:perosamine synthetase
MPVHFAGLTCSLEELGGLAAAADLAMIEDAAHAFGNRRQPRSATQVPNAVCYSFSANKNITCGEGGAVATHDPELARRVRAARYLGIDDDTWRRRDFDRPWSYQVLAPGYRYHLSDMHAAIGLQQLERLDEFRERRCALAVRYDATCARLDFVRAVTRRLPEEMPHLYVARIVGGLRDVVYHWLKLRGIQCGVHYVPNHLQPAFRAFYRPLPDTERLANELISLPLHTALTDADQDRVIQALTDFAPSRDACRPTHPDESHCVGASVR